MLELKSCRRSLVAALGLAELVVLVVVVFVAHVTVTVATPAVEH
jgi:hypothetical protein